MLAKNFQEQYLEETIEKLRNNLISYQQLYTNCYYEVEKSISHDVGAIAMTGLAKAQRFAGETIGKTPLKKTTAGNKLLSYSEVTEEKEKERIEKTKKAFTGLKDSGLSVFIKNLDQMNIIHNKPCELVWNQDAMYVCTRNEIEV